jgi:hypothetical protein
VKSDFEARVMTVKSPEALIAFDAKAKGLLDSLKASGKLEPLKKFRGTDDELKLQSDVAAQLQRDEAFKDHEVAAMAYAALRQLVKVQPQRDACMFNPRIKATIEFDVSRDIQHGGGIKLLVFKASDTETRSTEHDNSLEIDFEMQ